MASTDELWGTFAVDDHLRKRAYVADVILFDRVVIPKPPEDDKEQWNDWVKSKWDPERLKRTIGELGDLAVAVPWTQANRERWREAYTPLAQRARAIRDIGEGARFDAINIRQAPEDQPSRYLTRSVLVDVLERDDDALYREIKARDIDPAADIEVVVGYGSYEKFKRELSLDIEDKPRPEAAEGSLVLGWDFLVPEDSDLGDVELLGRAVRLARKDEFRASRREFHAWRRRLAERKVGAEAARAELQRCLKVYGEIVAKSELRHRVLTALQVSTIVAPAADFLVPGLGLGASLFLGVAAFAGERLAPDPKAGPREKVAALVHDSRKAFGWPSDAGT